MSDKLPALSGMEVIQALGRAGFQLVRIRGSHHFLRHDDGRATVVPVTSLSLLAKGDLDTIDLMESYLEAKS